MVYPLELSQVTLFHYFPAATQSHLMYMAPHLIRLIREHLLPRTFDVVAGGDYSVSALIMGNKWRVLFR